MEHIAGMVIFPGQLAFMEGLGGPEMMLIFVVILVLFGGQKLPEFARGLGKSMREFKKAAAGVEDEFKRAMEEDERKKSVAALPAAPTIPAPTILPPNPDGLPPEALAPVIAGDMSAAPSIDSIPPPPLIPLDGTATESPAPAAATPGEATLPVDDGMTPPAATAPATPPVANPPPPAPVVGKRSRDDYS